MKKIAFAVAYISSIIAANVATETFGLVSIIGITVTAGTFLAGAVLVLRDGLQEVTDKKFVLVSIVVGAVISAATSNPSLALASCLAFFASELVDFFIYTPLRKRSLPLAVIGSSVASAPIDTILFLQLAGFGVTTEAVIGQFIVKTIIAAIAAAGLSWRSISREA